MSSALYNREILRLAASLVPDDRLESYGGTGEARSPLCGSRIQVDASVDPNGIIDAIAVRASACAIGQASAAIMRGNVTGKNANSVADIRAGIAAALAGEGDMPAIWPDLELLSVARDYKARHAAILLPYDALLIAIENAKVPAR
jgi:NifU-like protein involved in Fe-S cluster formation